MTIRAAAPPDVDTLVQLGAVMHAESPRFSKHPYSHERVRVLLTNLIANPMGLVLVAERGGEVVGGFVGVAAQHWACDALTACDLALFVRPDMRGGLTAARLLCGYSSWCKQIGAAMATVGITTQTNADVAGRLMSGLGFHEIGPVFDVLME